MSETGKTGAEMLDEVATEPSLDRYLDRSPKVGQPINFEEMVKTLQAKRQWFINKKAEKENNVSD